MTIGRNDELSKRPRVEKKLREIFAAVEQGFADQRQRSDNILDYWDAYNCMLGSRQFYAGTSAMYLPIIRSAVRARATRFINQVFPPTGRYVEAITGGEPQPNATIALAEHYIRTRALKTKAIRALLLNGDIEGQYTLYVDWSETERHVVSRETSPIAVDGVDYPEFGEVSTIKHETIPVAGPGIEIIGDNDFLVLPATVDSLDEAIAFGGSVTVRRRWTREKLKEMIRDGDVDAQKGEALLSVMSKPNEPGRWDTRKELAHAAGIRQGSAVKYCQGFETWVKLKLDGEMRLCRAYWGGEDLLLGAKLNPYWNDRLPIVSEPVEKMPGVFKGMSLIGPGVLDLQVLANDTANELADAGHFSMFPIVMTDPANNPRKGTMVYNLAAIWETDPNSTSIHNFPDATAQGLQRISYCKTEIFQALSVTPAMVPQQTGGKGGGKRNQAEVALEQQADILNASESVSVLCDGILTPMVIRMIELDHQFRDTGILVRSFGEMGLDVVMEEVPPLQMDHRFEFRWNAIEQMRNQAQVQQLIATINVARGLGADKMPGHQLDLAPALQYLFDQTVSPRLSGKIFKDVRKMMAVDAKLENTLLQHGFTLPTHPLDNDAEHMQIHAQLLGTPGQSPQGDMGNVVQLKDPHLNIRAHIEQHKQAMQLKAIASMPQPGGQQGVPGGAGQPGVAGTPRPGAMPQQPRMLRGPAGMIPRDQGARLGLVQPPRKV